MIYSKDKKLIILHRILNVSVMRIVTAAHNMCVVQALPLNPNTTLFLFLTSYQFIRLSRFPLPASRHTPPSPPIAPFRHPLSVKIKSLSSEFVESLKIENFYVFFS